MFKKRNLIFLCLLILGVLLIAGYLFSKAPVTVTFDSQGGSVVDSQKVDHDGKPTKPMAPTRTGYTFDAWFKESGCTNAWDFDSDKVTSDVTLFAKWTPDYAIRDTGPAGGLIFYDKGSYSGGWRYLESAPYDQHANAEWGCHGTLITGADGIAVGTGEQNTIDIENGCATAGTAADICANLSLGGYSDWFLPSKDELNLMYTNLKVAGVGGFADDFYYCSSEGNAHYNWGQRFSDGYQLNYDKFYENRVRAVRAF
jgi:uncharacterized repeat protein (TIGR02543 family)